jgi:diguanylate cyclase (GGDEF)-like protein
MSRNSVLLRIVRTAALLIALGVLVLSVVTSVLAGRAKESAGLDHELVADVGRQADAVVEYFQRARDINLLVAQNPAFADFYTAPGTDQAKIRAGGPLIERINAALAYLELLYPGRIGEACFIDQRGAELARVVRGVAARPEELSPDESGNPFFAPTVALPDGEVHQSRAYVSPDTNEWVISNSTRLRARNGRVGIVHFEVTLDSFRTAARRAEHDHAVSIVDTRTGAIWVDSRTPHLDGATLGRPSDRSLAGLAQQAVSDGVRTLDGRRVAFRRIAPTPGNANTWYVAVSRPAPDGGWWHGLGAGSLALMLAALLTIALAGASLRSYHLSLRRSALHDVLTGLPNRTLLTDRLGQALRGSERNGDRVAVMVVDLDRFKEVNDTLGHHHGDQLLRQVAGRIVATVRGVDTVARLGGDEFAVVMPSISGLAAAKLVGDRLLAALHDSFLVDGISLDVEASIGAAIAPDHGTDPAELLRHADAALYTAKDLRTGWEIYDAARSGQAPTRLALLGDLRRALDSDGQIILHYQPKIDIALGGLVGVEALIRWDHPTRGRLAPDEFIPIAETTALIQRLTVRVLELALAQSRSWLAEGVDLPIAVNLSTRCLLDTTFPRTVLGLLARYEVPASALHLEITESTIMADPVRALIVLRALSAAGIRLSIDDFGTGYSSMAYLKQLPVDEIKVDRSFVMQMTTDSNDAVLVRSAIDLGHNLGLAVVAEGVEDEHALRALKDLGCDIAQGYHFGRPMDAGHFRSWLEANHPRLAAGAAPDAAVESSVG